jgi:hypothetical protein
MRNQKSSAFLSRLLVLAAGFLLLCASSDAAMLSSENAVVVLRVGDGTTALSSNAARVYLEEYAINFNGNGVPTSATHVQTIPVPHLGATEGTKLLIGGTASIEGGLNFSTNGQYLMFAGNNSFVGENNSGKRKIAGRLDLAGNVSLDAIYGAGTTSAGNAIRTMTSQTGNEYWFGMSANPGIAYRTWEGGNNAGVAATSLNTINTRRLENYNGQLYVGNASGTNQGVSTVGSGTPTGSGQSVTILPGMPTAAGPSPIDFFFADPNTLYVADDRTSTSGGLQKWVFDTNSSMWNLVYTKNIDTTNDSIDNGLRGLTGGTVGADGTVILFGTSTFGTTAVANFLVGMTDTIANTNPANVTVNTLASSASIPGADGPLTTFRGLDTIGVLIPEPGSLGLLAIGSLLLLSGRRRG